MKKEKSLETRSYAFDVSANKSQNGAIITGNPIVLNSRTNLNWFDEIIEQGALDNTDLTDVRFLINHDINKLPLARSRRNNGNSTMLLNVTNTGLNIEVNLDVENNSEAKSLYSAVERGDVSGMSFMFLVDEEKNVEWENIESEHPLRRIKKIDRVVEVSAVTFPAYEEATINTRNKVLENACEVLEKARDRFALEKAEKRDDKLLDNNLELEKEKLKFRLESEEV